MVREKGGVHMTLDEAECGQKVKIVSIPDDEIRVQAIRFGVSKGMAVTCIEKIWAGPVIIGCGKQEIAVGRNLARRIQVLPVW